MTNQTISKEVNKIVAGVARKYGEKYGMEVEDLQQELYLKLAEHGSLDSEEGNLIARTCYNKAVDMYRFERRRYDSKAQYESDEAVAQTATETGEAIKFH
ncbi:hypothetical protein CEW46_32140, partial [Bacillus cereus]